MRPEGENIIFGKGGGINIISGPDPVIYNKVMLCNVLMYQAIKKHSN
jgi:hypothetical protein